MRISIREATQQSITLDDCFCGWG